MQPVGAQVQAGNHGSQPTSQPRLVQAAHEFEAQMMKELLKPLTNGDALAGEDGDAGSEAALGDYASESLGRSLSDHGGFGIANQIVRQLSHSGNESAAGQVTGNPHGNTAMRVLE